MKDAAKTIGKLMDKAGNCFVAYIDAEGYPVTKAMLKPREREGIRTIWLSTNTSSNKVKAFRKNSKASIYSEDKNFMVHIFS